MEAPGDRLWPLTPRSNSNLNFRAQFASQSSSRRIPHSSLDPMANFAAQLKERFLGLVDRVTGCGRGAAAKEEATKPAMKEHVEIRSRAPNVSGGSGAGVN
ncbi:hypothetical protein VPH35_040652 [Triticum aestivum]